MKARFLALAALVLGLASCQTEPEGLNVNVGGEVDTTITVTIPDTETRAGGNNSAGSIFDNVNLGTEDDNKTMRYILKVYDANNNASENRQVAYSDGRTVNFDVRLVPNRHYSFVVWADYVESKDDTDFHYNTSDLTNITLNGEWNPMDETRDAFTGVYNTAKEDDKSKYNGSKVINITLTRPFAKLRVKTTDIKELADLHITPAYATVEYKTEYRPAFNALVGEAKAKGTEKKTHTTVFPVAPYTNESADRHNRTLFTDYFFANEGDAVSFILNVYEDAAGQNLIKSNNFNTDIAVNRNYLTTIQGNILTDGNNVKVDVTDAFANAGNLEDEPYYVEIWDGKSIEAPTAVTNPTTNEVEYYSVENGSQLAWLAAAVNGTLPAETYATRADNNNVAGMTFKLTQDIDLGGNAWTPISMPTKLSPSETFRGTFDGQGHTIKGLYVRQQEAAGLFGYVYAATIKNVTIEGANLYSNHYAGGVVAWVLNNKGNIKVPFVMENCYVKNSTISSTPAQINGEWDNGDKVGGLVGYVLFDNEGAVIENCSVENTSIKAYRDFGGLIGYAKGVAINNYTIENISLEQDLSHDYKAPNTPNTFGMIIGRNEGGNTINGGDYSYEAIANGVYKVNDNYYIYNANGLKWIADVVNATTPYTATLFDNATVKLMNDIDLNNQEWIPIGDDRSQRTEWHGVFDGQGHTVKNIKITKKTDRDDENKSSYGLFGNVKGTVKNLTVENVSISGAPKFIGALIGRLNGGLVENCHVKNSSVECENWTIGGLVGQFNNGKISGCTVENTTVKGYAAVGGITGIALDKGERVIENCSINGCTFVKNGSFGGDFDKMFGTIVGALYSGGLTVNLNNCTSSNNTLDGNAYSIPCGFIQNGDTLLVDGGVYIADGLTYKTKEKAYYVTNANGLATLNAMMANKTAGKNVKVVLGNDIDFTGKTWTPVDSHADTAFYFNEFDGKGHTISNLTINGQAMFTRFAGVGDVTIKDVTFDNAQVNSNGNINTSILTVHTYQNVLLDNVDVKNSTIIGGYKVAPLIATVYNEGASTITATLKNCDVENTFVKATSYDFGTAGMVAFVYEGDNDRIVFENCSVKDVQLYAPNAYTAHAAIYTAGSETLYNEAEGVVVENVTFENI